MANQMELSRMDEAIDAGQDAALYLALLELKKLQHHYHVSPCEIPDNCGQCIAIVHTHRALKNYEAVRSVEEEIRSIEDETGIIEGR